MMLLVQGGHLEVVRLLLDRGANIEAKGNKDNDQSIIVVIIIMITIVIYIDKKEV